MARCHWSTKTATVRERFSLSVIFVATAYVAGLLAFFEYFRVWWEWREYFLGVLFVVGATQIGFRSWNRPRGISMLSGMVYSPAFVLWSLLPYYPFNADEITLLIVLAVPVAISGALVGYLAGAIDSSIFVLHDFARDSLRAKRIEREKLRAAIGVVPPESPWDE